MIYICLNPQHCGECSHERAQLSMHKKRAGEDGNICSYRMMQVIIMYTKLAVLVSGNIHETKAYMFFYIYKMV